MPLIERPASPIVGQLDGLHLFHFDGAPCAQRVRFALGEKGLVRGPEARFDDVAAAACAAPGTWVSRIVSLVRKDHMSAAYAQIHPNLVVPALVHDRRLYLESMDIIEYLDRAFEGPPLVPLDDAARLDRVRALTATGQALHRSIRFVTFRWGLGRLARLDAGEERRLRDLLRGQTDGEKLVEFYEQYDRNGIDESVYRAHLTRLFDGFVAIEDLLDDGRAYLTGTTVTIADALWAMKVLRLIECGYPFAQLFPAVREWFVRVAARPAFRTAVLGRHRAMHYAFRGKAAIESLLGRGLRKVALEQAAARRGGARTAAHSRPR